MLVLTLGPNDGNFMASSPATRNPDNISNLKLPALYNPILNQTKTVVAVQLLVATSFSTGLRLLRIKVCPMVLFRLPEATSSSLTVTNCLIGNA